MRSGCPGGGSKRGDEEAPQAVETGRLVFGQRRILRLYVSRPLIPAVLLRPLPAVKVKGRIAEVEVYALV